MDGSLVGRNSAIANKNDIPALLVQRVARLRTKNTYDCFFLYYLIDSQYFINYVDKVKTSSGIPHISPLDIREYMIPIPPKPEQTKIAKILTTVDNTIEKTEQLINKYKNIKTGMMQDLFARGLTEDGKLRPKYEDAPELYKPSDLGMIPKEWEVLGLDDICIKITDGSHFSPKPREYGFLIGNVKDMLDYDFNYEICTKISKEEFDLLTKQNCAPMKGDVLLSKDGTIGKVIVFNGEKELVLLSSIAIIRPHKSINSGYLGEVFKTNYFNNQLYAFKSGSALNRIVLADIKRLCFPFPKEEKEQQLIFSRISKINNLIEKEKECLEKLKKLKQGLMQDLLTGKVRVKLPQVVESAL